MWLPCDTTVTTQPAASHSGLRSEIGLAVMMLPAIACNIQTISNCLVTELITDPALCLLIVAIITAIDLTELNVIIDIIEKKQLRLIEYAMEIQSVCLKATKAFDPSGCDLEMFQCSPQHFSLVVPQTILTFPPQPRKSCFGALKDTTRQFIEYITK